MIRPARPFLALATSGLAIALAIALLLASSAARAATTRVECGFDGATQTLCRINLVGGLAFHADFTRTMVETLPNGNMRLSGDLEIPTAGDPVVLFATQAELRPDGNVFHIVNATALMPFPSQGFLSQIEVHRQPMVSFGSDLGANLAFTGAPVHEEQRYFYFHINSILEAGYGPITMTTPGGQATAVLDPSDPYFYFGGELVGLGDDGKKQDDGSSDGASDGNGADGSNGEGSNTDGSNSDGENGDSQNANQENGENPDGQEAGDGSIPSMGIGFSLMGQIPFIPAMTYGVEDELPEFDGHLYLRGPIPVPSFPMLQVVGEAVLDIDPDVDGDHPFEPSFYETGTPDLALGANGLLSVGIPFLRFLEFGFDLGAATAVAYITEADQRAVFTGEVGLDQSSFLGDLPIGIEASGRIAVYGLFDDDLHRSFIHGEGEMGLDPSGIGAAFGVPLGNIGSVGAMIDINAAGLTVSGTTSSSPHPSVSFDDIGVEVHVSPDGLDSYLAMIGDLRIDTFELRNGRFEAHVSDGVTVGGEIQISNTVFGMNGRFALGGYSMSGSAALADAIELNATESIALADEILQHEETRMLLTLSLVHATETLEDANAVLTVAIAGVTAAQYEVNKIQRDIDYHVRHRTSNYNAYRSWKRKSCRWWDAGCHATRAARISLYWGRYAYHAGLVGTLSAAKTVALAPLNLAKAALAPAQGGVAAAEQGVATLLAQLDAIAALINDARARLDALPDIEGQLIPVVTATVENGTLTGTVSGSWNGMQLDGGRVSFANPAEACLTVPGMGELCSPL